MEAQVIRILQVRDLCSHADLVWVEWRYPAGADLETKLARLDQAFLSLAERIREQGTEIPPSLRENRR